jgi:hypothetical protein
LATGDRVHGVDGRDAGRDHFFGVHLAAAVSFERAGSMVAARTLE